MKDKKIGSRYLREEGLLLDFMDSRVDFGDPEDDYIIKKVFAVVENAEVLTEKGSKFFLVIRGHVEISHEHNEEARAITDVKDLYRIPFPYDTYVRKYMLRLFKENPEYYTL